MSPTFKFRSDSEHDAGELRFGDYVLVVRPGECHRGEEGHHLATYPAFVVRAPDPAADLPPPLWEVLTPPDLQVLRLLPGGRHET